MPTAEARVETSRASRYLVQLCRHASQMGQRRVHRIPDHATGDNHMTMPAHADAEWSDTHGKITVEWGTCTLAAAEDRLTLWIEADDEEKLQRIQDAVTRDLTRFSRRDPLTVNWQRPAASSAVPVPAEATARRSRRGVVLLVVAGALAVAAHVVAVMLSAPQWTTVAANVVLIVVLAKAALIAGHILLGRRILRRRKAR